MKRKPIASHIQLYIYEKKLMTALIMIMFYGQQPKCDTRYFYIDCDISIGNGEKNDGGPHMTSDNDTYCKLFSRIFVFTVGKEKQRIKVL